VRQYVSEPQPWCNGQIFLLILKGAEALVTFQVTKSYAYLIVEWQRSGLRNDSGDLRLTRIFRLSVFFFAYAYAGTSVFAFTEKQKKLKSQIINVLC